MELSDILIEGDDYDISLSKLVGKTIKDVVGYITTEYGSAMFKLSYIVFEDGSQVGVEGEHDLPYVIEYAKWPMPNLDDDLLNELKEQYDD